jgi:hypothetical protein
MFTDYSHRRNQGDQTGYEQSQEFHGDAGLLGMNWQGRSIVGHNKEAINLGDR